MDSHANDMVYMGNFLGELAYGGEFYASNRQIWGIKSEQIK